MTATVPKGWTVAALSDVALIVQGQSPPGNTYNTIRNGLPFFQGKAEFGSLTPSPRKWCTAPTKVAHAGDVLISIRAPVGPTNLADSTCCIGRGLSALEPRSGVRAHYLLHYLRHTESALRDKATGSTFDAISGKQLGAHEVRLAPSAEQDRIVAAIEEQLSRLDEAESALERVQRNLKRYRAAVLQAAVEGRLVPTEAALARAEGRTYEPASELLKRILAKCRHRWEETELARLKAAGNAPKDDKWKAKYEEPCAMAENDLPGLPEGWCWVPMAALCESNPQNGLYVPKSRYGAGTPILRIDDYQTDWSRRSNDLQRVRIPAQDSRKYGLIEGDLILNRVNSPSHLGKALVVTAKHLPAVFESNMMRIQLARDVFPAFLEMYINSARGKQRLTKNAKWAVNQASINQADVVTTPVPLPPLAEQERTVKEVERLLSVCNETISTLLTAESANGRLRQSMLKWAFEGKLVDQDPNDEPASVLLERIRAERATRTANNGKKGRVHKNL